MIVNTLEQRFAKWACDRLTKDADFGKKKTHFDLGGYVNKQNWRICGTENPHEYIKCRRTQNESLFGADFGPEA